MNVALLIAGMLALAGALAHGLGGEVAVVKRLAPGALPASAFGGPTTTKLMIRVTWHMVTVCFVAFGTVLTTCAGAGPGGACTGAGRLVASILTGFAGLAGAGVVVHGPRVLVRHPAPLLLTAAAALSWVGTA